MSILKRLFGSGSTVKVSIEPDLHKDFRIFAEPMKEPGGYRVAARIEKDVNGTRRSHRLVRADIFESEEAARDYATRKAKLLIDQLGESLLDS